MIFEKKIVAVGDSKYVLIPVDVLAYLEMDEGDDVCMQVEEGKHGKYFSVWKKVG